MVTSVLINNKVKMKLKLCPFYLSFFGYKKTCSSNHRLDDLKIEIWLDHSLQI